MSRLNGVQEPVPCRDQLGATGGERGDHPGLIHGISGERKTTGETSPQTGNTGTEADADRQDRSRPTRPAGADYATQAQNNAAGIGCSSPKRTEPEARLQNHHAGKAQVLVAHQPFCWILPGPSRPTHRRIAAPPTKFNPAGQGTCRGDRRGAAVIASTMLAVETGSRLSWRDRPGRRRRNPQLGERKDRRPRRTGDAGRFGEQDGCRQADTVIMGSPIPTAGRPGCPDWAVGDRPRGGGGRAAGGFLRNQR